MKNLLDPMTFPLHGVRLIAASAGTGKTYTIAALYLRLVLGHGGENGFSRPLTPPQILVVTFTNAATEELRNRIRIRLIEAAAYFRGQGRGDAYLNALKGDYDAGKWPVCARMLDQAAQWMDESAIHTIHAWCQQMIRQHAFDSGGLFDLELAIREEELLEEAACDYWRSHFYPQPKAVLSELIGICASPQSLLEKIRPLLKEQLDDPVDPFVQIERRIAAIEEARRIWEPDFDAAIEKVGQAQADKTLNGNKYRTASLIKWQEAMRSWVKENGPLPDQQTLLKYSRSGLEAGAVKNKSVPQHPGYEALDRLIAAMATFQIDTSLCCHAAADIARRIQLEKERSGKIGFDDLLTRLREALDRPGNGRLARDIREQFPVTLIDEFQDTDPVQYAIFSKVYLKGRSGDTDAPGEQLETVGSRKDAAIFMIGDPKQAIYAFRGADIHTYLAAAKDASGASYTLGTNFRATDGLVKAVNRVFGAGAENSEGAFLFKNRIPYVEVSAAGRKDRLIVQGRPASAMTFWRFQQDGPLNVTGDDGYINRMAESTASEIVRMLNLAQALPSQAGFQAQDGVFNSLRPADIAILVRTASQARAIRQALDKRRLQSVYLSDKDSVFKTPEAIDLLYLLRACAEPERDGFIRSALATGALALSFKHLDRLFLDDLAWEAEIDRFRNYRLIWRQQGVLPMLRLLFHEFGVSSRMLSEAGGERALTNLLHLAEMLQAAAVDLNGEQALIRWLAEQTAAPGTGVEEQILRLESDEDLIRVVTIHKSKGLEYPLVFLPFICSFRKVGSRNTPVVKIHDETGRVRLVLKPGALDIETADRERLAEDLRMLYVAMTRAQYACWLGVGVMGGTSSLHESALGRLLSAGEPIAPDQLTEKLRMLKGDCDHIAVELLPEPCDALYAPGVEIPEMAPALTFSGKIACDWRITSYSGMLTGARTTESEADDPTTARIERFTHFPMPFSAQEDQLLEGESEPAAVPGVPVVSRSIHGFPRGPEPGTFLHDILEWAAQEGFAVLASDRIRILLKITEICERRDWMEWKDVLTDWLQKLLQTRINLPDARDQISLAGLSSEGYQPELEFLLASHGVEAMDLDAAVTAAILPAASRPKLRENVFKGMLKGFIDLVFCHQGRYYVLDYKSNHLGGSLAAYSQKAMENAMLEHRYDLQYVLYTLALHRLLKARLPGYDYQLHVGGAVYLFLRGVNDKGQGVYLDKPPQLLIESLDAAFAGREIRHAVR